MTRQSRQGLRPIGHNLVGPVHILATPFRRDCSEAGSGVRSSFDGQQLGAKQENQGGSKSNRHDRYQALAHEFGSEHNTPSSKELRSVATRPPRGPTSICWLNANYTSAHIGYLTAQSEPFA